MPGSADSATVPSPSAISPMLSGEKLRARTAGELARALTTWLLPFALVLYLALEGGGYDAIVRSEVGIVAWWVVLLGALVGVLPAARIGRAAWAMLGLLVAFTAWTGLGIGWSESAERSAGELARVAALVGIFVLALSVQREGGLRRTAGAVATAIALVGGLALLSRLQPGWFPANEAAEYLPTTSARLNYPLNYWNGLAALIAIGAPLLLWGATAARSIPLRVMATAALPAMALTAYLTFSRGGAIALAAALAVLLLLHPRRLALLGPLALAAAGGGTLIAGASQRSALEDGLQNATALAQGDELLAMTVVVCLGVGLLAAALNLALRYASIPRPRISRRATAIGFATTALAAVLVGLAIGLPGELADGWEEFKQPGGPGESADRLQSVSGNGRYQWWEAAVEANSTGPLLGIGPGTYEYWWAQNGTVPGFVRDAHSLYLETLAELGIIGLLLILALVGGAIGIAAARSLDRADRGRAALMAASAAALASFAVAAAIDWAWEMTILPVVFLLLLAAVLGDGAERPGRPGPPLPLRIGTALAALLALAAIIGPMAGTSSVRASQQRAGEGAVAEALTEARRAGEIQPYAATPHLQEALLLEASGRLGAAAGSALEATERESTNWRTWLVLSRIEAQRGNADAAVAAFERARSLNPRSPLFAD